MLYIHPNSLFDSPLCKEKWKIVNNIQENKQNFRWEYHNKSKNNNKIKCGAIVLNKNLDELILIQNNYSLMKGEEKWGLPKGHREGNETYATCAKRELYEETGIITSIQDDMYKLRINNSYYFPIIIEKNLYKLSPLDREEIAQAKWIKIEHLEKYNVNRETKILIKRKLKSLIKSLKKGFIHK